jgi:AcrB/AcrD/AcrF family protein
VMTVACAFFGLVPIMWSTGSGADVMKRIAAPMIGGLFTSFLMELLVYPAIYLLWRERALEKGRAEARLRKWLRWSPAIVGGAAAIAIGVIALPHRKAPDLYPPYERIHAALFHNSLPDAKQNATTLTKLASDHADIAASAERIADSSDVASARAAFALLSDAMIAYRKEAPRSDLLVAYCPMVKHYWLQHKGDIQNPYGMGSCGEFKEKR